MPKVSIIMPAYNVENYIAASISSVISQSYTNWELIIINDGSTDNTDLIISQYVNFDSRITCTHQKNAGVSAARNKGLSLAKGEYISFLDSDDQYAPEYIERMLSYLLASQSEVAFCKFKEIEGHTTLKKTPIHITELYQNSFIQHIQSIPHSKVNMAFMYKLSHLKKLGYLFNTSISNAEDTEFILKVTYESTVCFVPYYLYIYVYRKNSLSRSTATNKKSVDKILTYSECVMHFLKNDHPNQKNYLIYLKKELASLYRTYMKELWMQLRNGDFTSASQGINYFNSTIPENMLLEAKYIYKYHPLKNIVLYFKIKILKSKNIKLWKILSKNSY